MELGLVLPDHLSDPNKNVYLLKMSLNDHLAKAHRKADSSNNMSKPNGTNMNPALVRHQYVFLCGNSHFSAV